MPSKRTDARYTCRCGSTPSTLLTVMPARLPSHRSAIAVMSQTSGRNASARAAPVRHARRGASPLAGVLRQAAEELAQALLAELAVGERLARRAIRVRLERRAGQARQDEAQHRLRPTAWSSGRARCRPRGGASRVIISSIRGRSPVLTKSSSRADRAALERKEQVLALDAREELPSRPPASGPSPCPPGTTCASSAFTRRDADRAVLPAVRGVLRHVDADDLAALVARGAAAEAGLDVRRHEQRRRSRRCGSPRPVRRSITGNFTRLSTLPGFETMPESRGEAARRGSRTRGWPRPRPARRRAGAT